jgi:hypothetical protein
MTACKVVFMWLNAFLMDLIPELGYLFGSFVLVTLVWLHSSVEVRGASNHSVLPSGHISFVRCYGSVLLSLTLGGYIANIVCTFLLWALLPPLGVNASRYLISVQNVDYFA